MKEKAPVDLRRHQRAPLNLPVEFIVRGSTDRVPGRATDVSLGGMFIETAKPPAFSEELVVHLALPEVKKPIALKAVVRWTRTGGMGVQFGLLGARETHAITELTRSARQEK
ncbi:MAG TPA: PilZ domain-containing protein [Polyangiaceae bacterium]|nr:PilZ domain-containing protein [Polyangiaceae bacterium]